MNRIFLTLCGAALLLGPALSADAMSQQPQAIGNQARLMHAAPAPPCGPPPTPAGFWSNPRLAERLGLSQEQVRSLRDIDYKFLGKAIKLRAELEQLQLAHEKLAAEKKEAEAKATIEKIAKLMGDLFKLHAEARTSAAKTLKPEQLAILEACPDPGGPPKGRMP